MSTGSIYDQSFSLSVASLALMYVREKDLKIPERIGKAPWKFRTKLELAAELVEWCVTLFKNWFRKRVMVVADGAYAKRPFLKRVKATGAVVVSRLRKDAALFDVPVAAKRPRRGRPRKYGRNQISLAHRGGHRHGWTTTRMVLYGRVGGFPLYGPKCVAGNDDRKRGRSFGHRTEFPWREGSAWCGRAAGPKRLVQCRVLEPVSLAALNGGVEVMEAFRDHIEAAG